MPIHNDFRPKRAEAGGVQPQPVPAITPQVLPNQPDQSRIKPKAFDDTQLTTEDVLSILPMGFDTMDEGVRKYFSDIEVPTKDGTRPMTVRVAGGDKSILLWKQDLSSGRIKLPVMSVIRSGWRPQPERFSHPSMPAYRRIADRDGTRMIITPRERSFLIDYNLSVWTERKRDVEYIQYQIVTRFNPMAEWICEDAYMIGTVQAKLNSISDVSGKDVAADELAKVQYDINITVEGYLPLPSRAVPTVLGRPQVLQDLTTGESYGAINPSPNPNT